MSFTPSIIPLPAEIESGTGFFQLSSTTQISVQSALAQNAADWFKATIYTQSGVSLPLSTQSGEIALQETTGLAAEAYKLTITGEGIKVEAGDESGFLYGLVTVLQLIPFNGPAAPGVWNVPTATISDAPRFGWRGLMLDSVRHFQPIWWVKKFIDAMALHKLNTLHWHLTDDQGWRVEIKKHPALTAVSAWRKESRVGHENSGGEHDFDGRPHGGFYSQDELRDIVAYAAARGIEIVPEIEMPGHATAVLAAYPHLSCTGAKFEVNPRWGIFDDVFCAGNDDVFQFMEDVLEEVLE
ncbi:beta-N-acetylhexosaminidase, partial [bacterium]